MNYNIDKLLKEREERVSKIILDEEFIPGIKYDSERMYNDLLRIKELLKKYHFVNSWKPIKTFFEIIQDDINNTKEIVSNVHYEYYEKDIYSSDNCSGEFILYLEPYSLLQYYYMSASFIYTIEMDIDEDAFDSNEFIKALINKIDLLSEKDIFDTLEYRAQYNIEKHGEKGAYSLLSLNHLNKLLESYQDKNLYPYLGNSEIEGLNIKIIDDLNVGNKLSIEKGKNFVCGNTALYIKKGNEYIGYLPEDFGKFLCPGIESGYIKALANITEIETSSYKVTKKYRKEKSKKDKVNRVRVDVIIQKGEKA